jgi:hypothetical protein
MPSRASKTGCVALLWLVSSFGCVKPSTNVALADADQQTPPASRATRAQSEADAGRRPHLERMDVAASVSGLGEMLDAAEQIHAQWIPPEPGAPRLDLQSLIDVELVQLGFDPGWLANVDLDGFHTVAMGLPHEGQIGVGLADYELAATIASRNPTTLVDALPPHAAPEPLEPNLWQIETQDGLRLLLRARPDTLEIATSFTQLDSLDATRRALQPGPGDPRVRLSLSHFDEDVLELGPLLQERGVAPDKQQAIIDAVELQLRADFGSDRDLMLHFAFIAPFGDTLVGGPILTDTSSLAKLLPTGALAVMVQSWAQPVTLGKLRQQLTNQQPQKSVPPLVQQLLLHGDDLVAQFGSENAMAIYVDAKGRATLLFLTSVADEQATKTAVRELFAVIERATPKLQGSTRVTVKRDAWAVGKQRSDVLSLEFPGDLRDTLDGMPWLLGTGTPTLELSATVGAGKLVIAIGSGQRELLETLVPRLSGSSDEGLERGGGLARARELTGGCQGCIVVDPVATAHGVLAILKASPDADRAFRKQLDTARKRLLGLGGEISMAARYDAQRWEFAVNIPKTLLLLGPDMAPRILESVEAIRDGYARSGGPSDEAICKHILDLMAGEMGQPSVNADDVELFLKSCAHDLEKEREKLGKTAFRKQSNCVIAARKIDEVLKCDDP